MDETDWLLLDAVSRAPRATNATLARVVGVSEPTVARRCRRLRSRGFRVQATVDISRYGVDPWTLRLRATPSAVPDLAAALVKRHDTAWVHIASGGTEIVVNALLAREPGVDPLLARLPRTAHVSDYTAHLLLDSWLQPGASVLRKVGKHHLSPEQVTELVGSAGAYPTEPPSPAASSTAGAELSAADVALIQCLCADARTSYVDLAAMTGEPESTTRSRLRRLHETGVIRFVADIPASLLDRPVEARLWINVQPAHAHDAAVRLAELTDTTFVAQTTGPTNLVATVASRTVHDLAVLTTRELGGIPGINSVETAPIHRTLKRLGDHLAGGQLVGTPAPRPGRGVRGVVGPQ